MSKRTFLGRRDESNAFKLLISYRHYFGVAASLSVFLLFAMAMILSFPFVNHTANTDAAANPATTSLTMTTGHTGAGLDIIASSANGTFAASQDSDTAKFTVATDNYTGYTLAIKGSNNNKQLANIDADAALDSIATDTGITADTFNTVAYNGKWGFKPSKINSVANTTKFYEAPSSDSPITLDTTSAANSTANEYSIGLGARVDYSNPAGTYSNTFILTAVTNPVSYTINYIDGTGDSTVANLPSAESSTTDSTSVVINPNRTPTRTGYTFAGKWCLGSINTSGASSSDYTTGTVCTGTEYAAGEAVSFIDQTAATNTLNLYAMWTPETYSITINPGNGVNSVNLNGTSCSSSCSVSNLKYNNSYALTADIQSGYDFEGWSNSNGIGTVANTGSANTTYTVGAGTTTLTATASNGEYTISLQNTDATTYGSTSATATYGSSSLTSITNPSRQYSASGFSTSYNNASGASVSSTATKYYTYSFKGWYTSTSGGSQIINTSGNLVASTSYTDSSARWNAKSGVTLYAQWNSGTSITLPTISKTGYDCGWTTSTSTSTITYASGYSGLTLTSNKTLYGVCKANTYTITLTNTNATSSGSTSTTATYGSSSLTSITNPSRQYSVSGFYTSYNNASGASVSSTSTKYYTYSFNGWWTNPSGGTQVINSSKGLVANSGYANSSSQWTYTNNLTLYARWNNGTSITLPTIYKSNYTCGWTTSTNTSSIMYTSGYSGLVPSSNMTLYGVCYYDPPTPTYSLYIDFAGTGVSSVQVRTSSGTSGSLMGTVSSSGGYVSGLYSGSSYYLYPSFSSGYEFSSWSKTSSYGSISSTTSSNPYFTMGSGTGRVTITGRAITYSLYIDFAGTGVSSVQVRTSSGTGGTLKGTVSSSGGYVSGLTPSTSYYLYPTFSSGYELDSWSKTSSYGTLSSTTATNPYFTMGSGTGRVTITGKSSAPYIQDYTDLTCRTEASNQAVTVIDKRDNKTYRVRYINDNCWMVDNLRFVGESTDSSGTMTLNSNTSNVSSSKTVSYGDLTSGNSYDQARLHVSTNTSYGVHYNYAAASAMTITGSSNSTDATYDICPKGWRLPTYEEQQTIGDNGTSGSTTYVSTWLPVYGGYYNGGSLSGESTYGHWWSSTQISSTGRYDMYYNSGKLYSNSNIVRYFGYYVRCLRNTPKIQDYTKSTCQSETSSQPVNVADKRDGKKYIVRYINGNCWMVDNLRYIGDTGSASGSMVMKTATSNISANKTVAYTDLTSGDSVTAARLHVSTNTSYGVYYNYAAASAKTITGSSNTKAQTYDICPKGWRLPTNAEQGTIGSSSGSSTYVSTWLPVAGGSYYNGTLINESTNGVWWSSTSYNSSNRYTMYYSGTLYSGSSYGRGNGYYVRCIRSS